MKFRLIVFLKHCYCDTNSKDCTVCCHNTQLFCTADSRWDHKDPAFRRMMHLRYLFAKPATIDVFAMKRRFFRKSVSSTLRNSRFWSISSILVILQSNCKQFLRTILVIKYVPQMYIYLQVEKKSLQLDIAQPACPSTSEFKRLFVARDINGTLVNVLQNDDKDEGPIMQQWFYTVTCNNNAFKAKRACPGCCIGIDQTK